jgi:hypothetical protein
MLSKHAAAVNRQCVSEALSKHTWGRFLTEDILKGSNSSDDATLLKGAVEEEFGAAFQEWKRKMRPLIRRR